MSEFGIWSFGAKCYLQQNSKINTYLFEINKKPKKNTCKLLSSVFHRLHTHLLYLLSHFSAEKHIHTTAVSYKNNYIHIYIYTNLLQKNSNKIPASILQYTSICPQPESVSKVKCQVKIVEKTKVLKSVRRKEGEKILIKRIVVFKVSESNKLKVTAKQNRVIKTKRNTQKKARK